MNKNEPTDLKHSRWQNYTIDNKDYPVVVIKQDEKKTTTSNLADIVLSGNKNNEIDKYYCK